MSFEQLLGDLEELRKAQAAPEDAEGDEKIQAAAEDAEAGDSDGGLEEGDGQGEDEDEDEPMGKSFPVTLADGQVIDAVDGTELVKSLMADVAAMRGGVEQDRASLGKAMSVMAEIIEEQGSLIKSLQERVEALANGGRGRKSTVVVDPAELAKSLPAVAATGPEVLAKCEAAFHAGRITGMDLAMAESAVNRGLPVSAQIVARLS